MQRWPFSDWTQAGIDAWALGIEASTVIGLRMAKMASGGDITGAEARRMIAEKIDSAIDLQSAMLTGNLGTNPLEGTQKVLRHYRRKVSANRRRLS